MKFPCPHCNGHIDATPDWYGIESDCPHCGCRLVVPQGQSADELPVDSPEDPVSGGEAAPIAVTKNLSPYSNVSCIKQYSFKFQGTDGKRHTLVVFTQFKFVILDGALAVTHFKGKRREYDNGVLTFHIERRLWDGSFRLDSYGKTYKGEYFEKISPNELQSFTKNLPLAAPNLLGTRYDRAEQLMSAGQAVPPDDEKLLCPKCGIDRTSELVTMWVGFFWQLEFTNWRFCSDCARNFNIKTGKTSPRIILTLKGWLITFLIAAALAIVATVISIAMRERN